MRVLVTAMTMLTAASAFAAPCPATAVWPGDDWADESAATKAAKADALKAMEDYAFQTTGTFEERKGIRTDGVVIIHHGKLIYERYANGWTKDKRHLAWSVSKSFSSAFIGIAAQKGLLAPEDSICKHLSWAQGDVCKVTVQNLLEMASGFRWLELYENKSNQFSSVLAMLYGEGHGDMAKFVAGHDFHEEPGQSWLYSTGEATLLMAVAQSALQPGDGEFFPWKDLFDPIGMKTAAFERDPAGTYIGGSYVYASARDFARFGYLYLNDGCWNGTRLLPEDWVAKSVAVNLPIQKKAYDRDPKDSYGWQWWLNKPIPGVMTEKPYKNLPDDLYMALGHWGQSINVFPTQDLIVVRVGDDRDGSFDREKFLELALKVVEP